MDQWEWEVIWGLEDLWVVIWALVDQWGQEDQWDQMDQWGWGLMGQWEDIWGQMVLWEDQWDPMGQWEVWAQMGLTTDLMDHHMDLMGQCRWDLWEGP